MKNIYQLQKLYRRALRRSAASLKKLAAKPTKNPNAKPWKGDAVDKDGRTIVNVGFHRARVSVCHLAKMAVEKDLLTRRVGLPGVRDARPLKVQHLEAQENLAITTGGL